MSFSPFFFRTAFVAGVLVLGLSACGRRGALEPPPDPSAPKAQQNASSPAPDEALPSPVGTPRSKTARRGYTIPKKPFILDPIL